MLGGFDDGSLFGEEKKDVGKRGVRRVRRHLVNIIL